MTGRLFASVVWVTVLLLAPLRRWAGELALLFWPSRLLPQVLQGTVVRTVFLAFALLVAYVLTAKVATWAIASLRQQWGESRELLRPHGGDGFWPTALALAAFWVVFCWLFGCSFFPLGAAVVVALTGLWGGREPVIVPLMPEPCFLPVPPEPLPEPGAEELPALPEEEEGQDLPEGDGNFIFRTYRWKTKRSPFLLNSEELTLIFRLAIPKDVYERDRRDPHEVFSEGDFVKFILAELHEPTLGKVAAKLRQISEQLQFDCLDEIHLAMAFTLSFRYASDEEEYGREYPKFPVEMLVDMKGDCEDHANLCAAILYRLGYRVALVLLSTGDSGHAAIAVETPIPVEGLTFYVPELGCQMAYAEVTPGDLTTQETTAVQWWLGKAPPEGSNYSLYPIKA